MLLVSITGVLTAVESAQSASPALIAVQNLKYGCLNLVPGDAADTSTTAAKGFASCLAALQQRLEEHRQNNPLTPLQKLQKASSDTPAQHPEVRPSTGRAIAQPPAKAETAVPDICAQSLRSDWSSASTRMISHLSLQQAGRCEGLTAMPSSLCLTAC